MRRLLIFSLLMILSSMTAWAHPDGTLGPHQHKEVILTNALAVHMRDACISIAEKLPATDAPWTDPLTAAQEIQCTTWLIKVNTGIVVRQLAEDQANIDFWAAIDGAAAAVDSSHPNGEIIATAVCGDGIITIFTGEECDNGDSNSSTEPDACRTNCRDARCGDGVVDTGETCDPGTDDTCLSDCSGAIP